MLNTLAIVLVVIGTLLGAVGSLFMKKGAKEFNMNVFKQLRNYPLIFGIGLFVISSVFYIYALRLERLAVLYPLTALSYIWVSLLSVRYLNEKMNLYKWTGIFLIIIGTFLIAYFSI